MATTAMATATNPEEQRYAGAVRQAKDAHFAGAPAVAHFRPSVPRRSPGRWLVGSQYIGGSHVIYPSERTALSAKKVPTTEKRARDPANDSERGCGQSQQDENRNAQAIREPEDARFAHPPLLAHMVTLRLAGRLRNRSEALQNAPFWFHPSPFGHHASRALLPRCWRGNPTGGVFRCVGVAARASGGRAGTCPPESCRRRGARR